MTEQSTLPLQPLSKILAANPYTDILTHPEDPNIKVQFALITPEIASMILHNKPGWQRKVSELSVERYAVDMANGQFKFNGATICFDDADHLIDGQHRLHSIAQTGESLIMLLVFGLESSSIGAIDTGRKRRFSDWLSMNGFKEQNAIVSGMVVRTWHWNHGNYSKKNLPRVQRAQFTNAVPSTAQLAETWQQIRDEGIDWVQGAQRGWQSFAATKVSPGIWGFAYILFSQIDLDAREKFFAELIYGVKDNGSNDHPINLLRSTLLRRKDEDLADWVQLHFIFTAWNALREGRTLGTLRKPVLQDGRVTPESLATPLGWQSKERAGDLPV